MKKIVSFDFDGTLFFTPEQEQGKIVFKNITGLDWPYRGWWGRKESLDLKIFSIPINQYVYDRYLMHSKDTDTHVILATGRLGSTKSDLTDEVMDVLDQYDLTPSNKGGFKEVYLNPGMDTYKFKTQLFERLISKYRPDEFIMYDDRREHLDKFSEWAQTQPCKITIIDVVNKIEKSYNN